MQNPERKKKRENQTKIRGENRETVKGIKKGAFPPVRPAPSLAIITIGGPQRSLQLV